MAMLEMRDDGELQASRLAPSADQGGVVNRRLRDHRVRFIGEGRRSSVDRLKTVIGMALVAVVGDRRGGHSIPGARPPAEWRYYGADHAFTRYSPLDQVESEQRQAVEGRVAAAAVNATLADAFPDLKINPYLKSTPIVVDGVVSRRTPTAWSPPSTARPAPTVWEQEPLKEEAAGDPTRGLDFWRSGAERRIVAIRGEYLYALDAATGKPAAGFGTARPRRAPFRRAAAARRQVQRHVRRHRRRRRRGRGRLHQLAPATAAARRRRARDDVRGFSVRTGKLLWTFHVVPQAGRAGHRDAGATTREDTPATSASWNPLSADDELGYVYLPLTAPTSAAYGGWRPGDNLYPNSLVALDAKTGKRVWHFQMVHHDLWEYDNVGPPTLGDHHRRTARRIKAVVQPSKNGFLYVLDRDHRRAGVADRRTAGPAVDGARASTPRRRSRSRPSRRRSIARASPTTI